MDQFVSGTPGWLFSGYGSEAQHNWFHGGTIFNDTASGAIWVEHQISLGAGETICAKERFEEWLYELSCVEVALYHSDNGVFTAAEFQEDCKLKGSSVHISSFSKTCSPWTVCTFGVIPEQGKKLNQNSLFHSSTAERTYILILVDL
jgi:hypothetical protein